MEEKPQILKNKKLVIIAVFVLLVMVVGVTYAFFNYTRTGTSNTASVGRIYFNTDQANDTLTLTNVFPSNSVPAGADSVSVHIVGDTAYFDGEEYQITLVNVVNTINAGTANEKTVPINYVATYQATTNKVVGSQAVSDYYSERTANVYDLTGTGVVEEGVEVLKGYIAPNATGIDGTLTIKAYLDASKVVISDTLTGGAVNVQGYTNGTPTSEGVTVLTTSEWNALQGNSTLSFKIKAEANEGKWLNAPVTAPLATTLIKSVQGLETTPYGKVYSGATVNNYVWFNNEQWRILGVYTDAVTGQENLKIIKATPSTTSQKWQNSNSDGNTWAGSLMQATYLYGNYETLISDPTSRAMIEESATWNVGACGYNIATSAVYDCANDTPWTGKIGLIGSYEYLYAAENDGTCWSTSGFNYYGGCYQKDWLFNTVTNNGSSSAWTLSAYGSGSGNALNVGTLGGVGSSNVGTTYSASPAVYLKSTITITGGNGGEGETDSYKLG